MGNASGYNKPLAESAVFGLIARGEWLWYRLYEHYYSEQTSSATERGHGVESSIGSIFGSFVRRWPYQREAADLHHKKSEENGAPKTRTNHSGGGDKSYDPSTLSKCKYRQASRMYKCRRLRSNKRRLIRSQAYKEISCLAV